MRALGLLLAIMACGAGSKAAAHPPDDNEIGRHARPTDDDDDDEPARPARAIAMTAATADGRSAVSADSLGHVRLWPTLTGTPIDLDLPSPKSFAIAHGKQRGFAIAEIDDAGDLVIADVDAAGTTRARTTLANDPAFVRVAMTTVGAVAWRADHSIVVVGADGKIAARIAAPPGDQVIDVATAGAQAIVLLQTPDARRLRRLELGGTLAWGSWIADDGCVLAATTIALSPNGRRLAMIIQSKAQMVDAMDIASGKRLFDLPAGRHARSLVFTDADHIVVDRVQDLATIDLGTEHPEIHHAPKNARHP